MQIIIHQLLMQNKEIEGLSFGYEFSEGKMHPLIIFLMVVELFPKVNKGDFDYKSDSKRAESKSSLMLIYKGLRASGETIIK